MRIDLLQQLHDFITVDNFTYGRFGIYHGVEITSDSIYKFKGCADKGCLAFYTVTEYQDSVPVYLKWRDAIDEAARILEIDDETADFLFMQGTHIQFPFRTSNFSSDAAECKGKIKFLLENYG